jgi:hypothetical protein
MKKFFGVLCALSFIAALGTVGAIEQDMVDLVPGMIRAFTFAALFGLFGKLSGAYDAMDEGGEED